MQCNVRQAADFAHGQGSAARRPWTSNPKILPVQVSRASLIISGVHPLMRARLCSRAQLRPQQRHLRSSPPGVGAADSMLVGAQRRSM